jgi:hypothetical protein
MRVRYYLENLSVDGRIVLKYIIKRQHEGRELDLSGSK